jgi:hypothetical protein
MPDEHPPFPSLRDPIPGAKSQPGQGAAQRRKAFVRLANKRVTSAIDAITLIGNLSNKKNYRYLPSDIEAIEAALHASVERTMAYFRSPRTEVPSFHLPEEGDGEEC